MDLTIFPDQPLTIGASGMDAVLQNIRVIALTTMYSVPLDRGFAHTGDFIDSPSPLVTARLVARLIDAIEAREPRVAVRRITLEAAQGADTENAMRGRLYPRIYFALKKGVTL